MRSTNLPNSSRTGSRMSKRAALPKACDFTKSFVKDWTRLTPPVRHDMARLR